MPVSSTFGSQMHYTPAVQASRQRTWYAKPRSVTEVWSEGRGAPAGDEPGVALRSPPLSSVPRSPFARMPHKLAFVFACAGKACGGGHICSAQRVSVNACTCLCCCKNTHAINNRAGDDECTRGCKACLHGERQ
jgi:hypothetical protein